MYTDTDGFIISQYKPHTQTRTRAHKHTHTQKAGGDCSRERGIDGNAITPNKQTLNHTLIPSQL